ncbi:MAG: Holliday junction branch migration protein RuvA [Deltaproteobacteria bacterium]|nr:Holliday junction branch migration protein RuvA [Deltaproteobacteria bacterium]
MIACLDGRLRIKELDQVVVDVGGVGYQVLVSTQTLAELPAEDEQVFILCHTHVREDALQLFGFASAEERSLFHLLVGVSGVGPKLALTILSGLSVTQLVEAISAADHKRLQGIPGIGKRTAERLVVDLRDRVASLAATVRAGDGGGAGPTHDDDVIEALTNLGYKRAVAERALGQVQDRTLPPEQLLRSTLALISDL